MPLFAGMAFQFVEEVIGIGVVFGLGNIHDLLWSAVAEEVSVAPRVFALPGGPSLPLRKEAKAT